MGGHRASRYADAYFISTNALLYMISLVVTIRLIQQLLVKPND